MEEVWGLLPSAAHIDASVNQPCGECAQYGFRGMGLRRISPQRAAQQASLLNCIGIGKITASSAKEFDHIPVIRTQKRFAGHFCRAGV